MRVAFPTDDLASLSPLGDGFVNLVYSIAVSNVKGTPTSLRASNYILAEALKEAGMRQDVGPRANRHIMGDYVEGYFFSNWINGRIGVMECVEVLEGHLDTTDRLSLRDSSVKGFTMLLEHVRERAKDEGGCPCNCAGYSAPAVTVDLVIEGPDGKILLIKRGKDPFKDRWALPGGFVECGETAQKAAGREALEETGIEAEIDGVLGVYSRPGRDPRGHTVSITFTARGKAGEPQGGDDAAQAKYFTLEETKDIKLAFDHKEIINDYLERIG